MIITMVDSRRGQTKGHPLPFLGSWWPLAIKSETYQWSAKASIFWGLGALPLNHLLGLFLCSIVGLGPIPLICPLLIYTVHSWNIDDV